MEKRLMQHSKSTVDTEKTRPRVHVHVDGKTRERTFGLTEDTICNLLIKTMALANFDITELPTNHVFKIEAVCLRCENLYYQHVISITAPNGVEVEIDEYFKTPVVMISEKISYYEFKEFIEEDDYVTITSSQEKSAGKKYL